ncbi:hypothetical protein PR202_ga09821 [Eleusine coracana subsp. coracana]|uniref:Uncharacterized protein n=1 Tax=Eleusine coracana subsp. coracana TaxID=191504 RepID=A0AAV5C434_ELECO|nr:hypothetical protein PR202_ga09821 [Eleusine coracana subsp. coracana]
MKTTEWDKNISPHGELGTCLSWKWPVEDDKAKSIAKVMRTLDVDKLTIELFCAILSLYKWNVDEAAEQFDICRGKQQIPPEQSMKKKLVSQFNFVKEQLRQFFPLGDNSCASMHETRKNNLEMINLSNQSLSCDLTPAKRKLVDKDQSCDLPPQQKRKVGKLPRGSPHTQKPRRSPRLTHLKNTSDRTNNTMEERSEVLGPSPAPENQVKDRADKTCLLHEKRGSFWKGIHEEVKGSLSQGFRRENIKELTERNVSVTSETFISTGRIEIESLSIDCELTSDARITEPYFTWKPSQQGTHLERILLDIERENFMNTITHVQKIIRDECPDLQTAYVIEDIVRICIRKWDVCLQDSSAQKVVNALLEHAKIIKEEQNFNIEVRKEEFSAKIQDRSKWQLKELETGYISLELDYKKATEDASICFSTLQKHKKELHAIEDDIKHLQQAMMMKEDEVQKLRHLVSEHETMYQKSTMERVRVKMAMNRYQQTLDEVKRRLASTESGSIDVEVLVKEEMDNMRKEIELSKGSILSIKFMKE